MGELVWISPAALDEEVRNFAPEAWELGEIFDDGILPEYKRRLVI
jgi:hypothetical protein